MLSKEASSTIFWVFGMTRPGIEPMSPGPKAPFSIATTPRCRDGATLFPGLFHFILDPYLIMLSVKQEGIKYHFLSLWYDLTWDWIPVTRTIDEHSTHQANHLKISALIYLQFSYWLYLSQSVYIITICIYLSQSVFFYLASQLSG